MNNKVEYSSYHYYEILYINGEKMIKYFKWEMKLKLKSTFTAVVILIICIISLINMQIIESKRHERSFTTNYATDSFIYLDQMKWIDQLTEENKKEYPKSEYTYQLYDEIRSSIWRLSYSDYYNEMNRLQAFLSLLTLRNEFDENGKEVVSKEKIFNIWNSVSNGVPYESIDFYVREKGTSDFPINLYFSQAMYFSVLYSKNLDMAFNDELSNVSFLYDLYDKVIPFLVILLSFLSSYSSINRAINNGQIKFLLTSGQKRTKIYLAKCFSNVVYIWLLIIPLSLFFAWIAGVKGQMINIGYPMFALKNPLSNITSIPNYYDVAINNGRYANLYPNAIGRTAPLGEYFMYGGDISDALQLITFLQFMLLVIVLIIFYLFFIVALVQFFSTLFRHEFIGLITSIIIFSVGYGGMVKFMEGKHFNISPFNAIRFVRIVEGVNNTTYLLTIITLFICSVVLLFGGCLIFSRKEI